MMNTPHSDPHLSARPSAGPQTAGTKLPAGADRLPLARLPEVSFASRDGFLNELSTIERLLPQLPVELQRSNRYLLELIGGELHIYGRVKGITDFSLTEGGRGVLHVEEQDQVLRITLAVENGEVVVVLHRRPKKEPPAPKQAESAETRSRPISRRTSPWRAGTLRSHDSAPSESRGGGSGER